MWGSVEGFLKCRKISTLVETYVEKLDKAGSTVLHRIDELALHQSDAPEHKSDRAFGIPVAQTSWHTTVGPHNDGQAVECKIHRRRSMSMRRMGIMIASVFLLLLVPLLSVSATAQEARSEISLQGTGLFTKDTTGRDTTQRGTENGGFLVGYRYPFNRWFAAEGVTGSGPITHRYFAPAGLHRIQ